MGVATLFMGVATLLLQVLHRDLKPANVFLDGRGQVKLGDFGLARVLRHNTSVAQTFVGTPYYMAPVRTHTSTLYIGILATGPDTYLVCPDLYIVTCVLVYPSHLS